MCLTLCYPMDHSLPCSSIHGIFQARVLEWGAISFSRGSSQPRNRTWVSCIVGRRFTIWATREVLSLSAILLNSAFKWVYLSFLISFCFFFSYFKGLLRQPFCLFAFLFMGDGLDHCLVLYFYWSSPWYLNFSMFLSQWKKLKTLLLQVSKWNSCAGGPPCLFCSYLSQVMWQDAVSGNRHPGMRISLEEIFGVVLSVACRWHYFLV